MSPSQPAVLLAPLLAIVLAACGRQPGLEGAEGVPAGGDPVARFNAGVAILEHYDYPNALKVFAALAKEYPDWEAAHVNAGLASLNLNTEESFATAEKSLRRALEINPRSLHALVSLGILLQFRQRSEEAFVLFGKAFALDAGDPHILYYLSVLNEEKGNFDEARKLLDQALRVQPSFATAHWRLRNLYVKAGDRAKMEEVLKEFKRLEQAQAGIKTGFKYGEGGRYSLAIRDAAPPGWKGPPPRWKEPPAPAFGPPVRIGGSFAPPRQRPSGKSFVPGFALADVNGDGSLEVIACGAEEVGVLTVNARGPDGSFAELLKLGQDAILCAAGDLDGDRDVDLALAGEGWLQIMTNDGRGGFTTDTIKAPGANHAGFPLRLLAVDADSDWDLDLLCLREEAAGGGVRSRLEVLNNNRDGTFRDIAAECAIGPFPGSAAELVARDLDGDIDLDLVVFGESGAHAFANDRVWRYRQVEAIPAGAVSGLEAVTLGDGDGDGDEDLIIFAAGGLRRLRNEGGLRFAEDEGLRARFGALGGTTGVLADFQEALRAGLLVLDAKGATPGPVFIAAPDAPSAVPVTLADLPAAPAAACFAPIAIDGPVQLIVRSARALTAYPLRSAGPWLGLDLQGPDAPIPDKERANAAGTGATVEVRVGQKSAVFRVPPSACGAAPGGTRLHFGLNGADAADYVRLLWPDGVLQAERGLTGGKVHPIKEVERKPSSCPILFAWTGKEYRYVGDFLGVGGLGYFELPGAYSRPDPSEQLLLPALEPLDGAYRLDVLEPLEECTYLDALSLVAVDSPAGVSVIPEEMFAIRGPQPVDRLLAFRERVFAARAEDGRGRDVTAALRDVDRIYGNEVVVDTRFPGLARRPHAITLDFADGAARVVASGPAARPYLFLHGYVEYGYSTSNFAAWQARESFRAPTVLAERDGKWEPLREEWGFPAGTPRYMTVDLTGRLAPGDRRLRVETNMEIHWDQAFLADASAVGDLRVTELQADTAALGFRGYPPEESPDGKLPLVYAYRDFVPSIGYKDFPGDYTRYGDVRDLLVAADDRFAVFGPGDGLALSFRAAALPALPAGWKRTFVARAFGYCKDMDLYTAHPDRVEPLPFRGMSGYPYGAAEAYPSTDPHARYRREWNTRRVGEETHGEGNDLPRR